MTICVVLGISHTSAPCVKLHKAQIRASETPANGSAAESCLEWLCSLCPTFAAIGAFIQNARWDDVPFLLKAGKALHSKRAEIRVQFRHVPGNLYRDKLGIDLDRSTNELVREPHPAGFPGHPVLPGWFHAGMRLFLHGESLLLLELRPVMLQPCQACQRRRRQRGHVAGRLF